MTLIVRVGGIPWPINSATQYHAMLGLPDKGSANILDIVEIGLLIVRHNYFKRFYIFEGGNKNLI